MITLPFTDYRGSPWSQTMADTYNRFDAEVEKREKKEPPRGSLTWQELEFYRDQRHKTFVMLADIAQGIARQSTAPAARPDFEQLP
jgi:hypothetical protein